VNDTDGKDRTTRSSRRLAYHLRHAPERIGIELDSAGWVDVDVLLTALAAHGKGMSRADLDRVVAENDKRRFAFDATGTRIRASQGHSVEVDLDLPVAIPPDLLYHGTVAAFLPAILRTGLRPMNRHDVHLSHDAGTATTVGARRGTATVLTVDAGRMARDGHEFRVSANGVWLARAVPPEYLTVPTV
jgi:putative RNA 2'-phosphotransferase